MIVALVVFASVVMCMAQRQKYRSLSEKHNSFWRPVILHVI